MTEPPASECRCLGAAAALHYALSEKQAPTCPQHDPEAGVDLTPIALNNDAALAAKIGARLNKETN